MKQKQINYPEIKNNDIKVLGRVVSIASANKVAAAEQVFDEKFNYDLIGDYSWDNIIDATRSEAGMDQYTINRLFGKKLKNFDDAFQFGEDGWFLELKVRNLIADNATINNKLTTKDLEVTNNATIKNLHVTENSTFDGDVTIGGDLIVNNKNIGDLIEQILRVISGDDKTSEIWRVIQDHERRIQTLEACCEDMHNNPTGGVNLSVNPDPIDITVGDPDVAFTVTPSIGLSGNYTAQIVNTSIATLVGGKVHAVAEGNTQLKIDWLGIQKTVQINVSPKPLQTFRVTFYPNNGQDNFHQDVQEGNKLVAVTNPVKDGYTFDGWHKDTESGIVWNFNDVVTSSMSLVAGYTQNEEMEPTYWTVTYNPNIDDDTILVSTETVEDGHTAPSRTLSKNGYTFNGWTLNGSTYDFNTPVHSNITLMGSWTEEEVPVGDVTVTFDSNGGSAVASQTIQSGSTVTRPTDPTYTGKLFGGWYFGNDQFSFSTPITSDITLVAHWVDEAVAPSSIVITGLDRIPTGEKTTYSAQVVPSNASVDTEITWSVATGGGTINASTGEYTAPDTAQTVEIKATAANGIFQHKSVEVYVTEVPVEYVTISFDTDGGTPTIADQTVEMGTTATQPSAPIKLGHTFLEWRLVNAANGFEAGHVWDFSDVVTENTALRAFYSENAPDPVPVSSVTIFGPSEVQVSTKNENQVSNTYTVQFNDGANTGTAVTWSIDDDVPAGSDQATRLENKGQISGQLGTNEAYYISPYHNVDSVVIRVTSENGTTATKTIKVTGEPQPDPTYTVSWTCTYLGEDGAGYCSIKNMTTGSEEVQAGQNWGPATFVTPSGSQYTLTDNGVDIKEASVGSGITINNINENHEILLSVTGVPLWVTVTGDNAQVMDYGTNGGTWRDVNTSPSFNKDTSGMGNVIYTGSSVSYDIRPAAGYEITGVSFQYDGDAADEDGIAQTLEEINENFGHFYIRNIKSDATVTITTR